MYLDNIAEMYFTYWIQQYPDVGKLHIKTGYIIDSTELFKRDNDFLEWNQIYRSEELVE